MVSRLPVRVGGVFLWLIRGVTNVKKGGNKCQEGGVKIKPSQKGFKNGGRGKASLDAKLNAQSRGDFAEDGCR